MNYSLPLISIIIIINAILGFTIILPSTGGRKARARAGARGAALDRDGDWGTLPARLLL